MGGFILYKKNKIINGDPKMIFKKKNIPLNAEIEFLDYTLATFSKRSFSSTNLFPFNGSDFIASVGTPIYKFKTGIDGAKKLYSDLLKSPELDFSDFNGHYCYIIYIQNKLLIFNDYNGIFHVYHDEEKNILSSSFLAVSESISNKQISVQEIYEYIFCEAVYGNKTILKNVDQLDSKYIYQLYPNLNPVKKNYPIGMQPNYSDFNEMVEFTTEKINKYFNLVLENFKTISLGLSGGFDSRLLLMCLLKNGKKPFLYTRGTKNSYDVNFADSMSKKYALDFTFYDSEEKDNLSPEEYKKTIEEKFLNAESFSYNGVFQALGKSMDIDLSKKAEVNLNGAGGEIYRNFWKLPENKTNIIRFVISKYYNFSTKITTDKFSKDNFFNILAEKNLGSLDVHAVSKKVPGSLIHLTYPNFRLKYWFGKTTSRMNQYSYALVPFSEPYFYLYSYLIPVRFKIAGKFEAALLKNIDPEIAKYDSNYGFNFFDGPSLKDIILDWYKIHTPIFIRPFLRIIKMKDSAGLYELRKTGSIFFKNDFLMKEFINMENVPNANMYSRILTVEYFLRNFM